MLLSQLKIDSLESFCKSKAGLNIHHRKLCSKTMRGQKGKGKQRGRSGWCLVASHCSRLSHLEGKVFLLDALRETILPQGKGKNGGLGFGSACTASTQAPSVSSSSKDKHEDLKHMLAAIDITNTRFYCKKSHKHCWIHRCWKKMQEELGESFGGTVFPTLTKFCTLCSPC